MFKPILVKIRTGRISFNLRLRVYKGLQTEQIVRNSAICSEVPRWSPTRRDERNFGHCESCAPTETLRNLAKEVVNNVILTVISL